MKIPGPDNEKSLDHVVAESHGAPAVGWMPAAPERFLAPAVFDEHGDCAAAEEFRAPANAAAHYGPVGSAKNLDPGFAHVAEVSHEPGDDLVAHGTGLDLSVADAAVALAVAVAGKFLDLVGAAVLLQPAGAAQLLDPDVADVLEPVDAAEPLGPSAADAAKPLDHAADAHVEHVGAGRCLDPAGVGLPAESVGAAELLDSAVDDALVFLGAHLAPAAEKSLKSAADGKLADLVAETLGDLAVELHVDHLVAETPADLAVAAVHGAETCVDSVGGEPFAGFVDQHAAAATAGFADSDLVYDSAQHSDLPDADHDALPGFVPLDRSDER